MTREERLEDMIEALCDEAAKSVEYSDWPELQELIAKARALLAELD